MEIFWEENFRGNEMIELVGAITIYSLLNQPLYCNDGINNLFYTFDTKPWVALDVNLFRTRQVECGEIVYLKINGETLRLRAWDAGYLAKHNVEGATIVADLPAHLAPFEGLSTLGEVWIEEKEMKELMWARLWRVKCEEIRNH